MKKRLLAMLLASALCVTLGLAADADTPLLAPMDDTPVQTDETQPPEGGAPDAETAAEPASADPEGAAPAAPDADAAQAALADAPANQAAANGKTTTEEAEKPQSVTIGFTGLERTIREKNLIIQANDQKLQGVEQLDLESSKDEAEWGLDGMKALSASYQDAIDSFINLDEDDPTNKTMIKALSSMKAANDMQIASMEKQIDNLDETIGDKNDTYATTKKTMQGAADQLVMGAQGLFISLTSLDLQQQDLQRQLTATDRQVAEMQKRYDLGQISEIQLLQVKNGRAQLASGIETLKFNVKGLKGDLAVLLGYEPGVQVSLSPLPAPAAGSRNLDADLKEAIKNSYTLFSKQDAMRTASNDYERDVTSTVHNYNAAKINYQAAEQQLKQSFTKLYDAVGEKQRLYELATDNEAVQARLYETASTKYQRGMISKNEYLTAKEDYTKTQNATQTAQIDLFTAINQYDWAKRGVVA